MPLLRSLLLIVFAAAIAGCGFQLRGTQGGNLPYQTIFIALPETADVRIWLERYIRATGGTQIVNSPGQAEASFQQLGDNRQKIILSVNAQGRVREYRLQLNYSFRVVNAKGQEIVGPNQISLSRDITYDDSTVLAKDQEEGLLWRDMNQDLVNQIMRRLSLIKPKDPEQEDDL